MAIKAARCNLATFNLARFYQIHSTRFHISFHIRFNLLDSTGFWQDSLKSAIVLSASDGEIRTETRSHPIVHKIRSPSPPLTAKSQATTGHAASCQLMASCRQCVARRCVARANLAGFIKYCLKGRKNYGILGPSFLEQIKIHIVF